MLYVPPLDIQKAGRSILTTPSISFAEGTLTAILGPNGAGKSTLLKRALLVDGEYAGTLVGTEELAALTPTERSRRIAYLPQKPALAWPLSVSDAVALGRFAFGAGPGRLQAEDYQAVEEALKDTNLESLKDRRTDSLSGGELARVHIARLLAAETPVIVADEPTASLDPKHQHQLMELLRKQTMTGKTVVIVLHDLALSYRYAKNVVLLKDGQLLAHGPTVDVLTPETIEEAYAVCVEITSAGLQVKGPARPPSP